MSNKKWCSEGTAQMYRVIEKLKKMAGKMERN